VCTTYYCKTSFNDASWRDVNVPHDFVVEGNFSSKADKSHGYLPYAIGWYRKHVNVPHNASGKALILEFEGTMRDTKVYWNNILLGGTWHEKR